MRRWKYHINVEKQKAKEKEQKEAEQREIDARACLKEYMKYAKEKKKQDMAKSMLNWAAGKWDSALKKVGIRPKRRDQKIFMTKKQWEEKLWAIYMGDTNPWLTGRGFQEEPKLKF